MSSPQNTSPFFSRHPDQRTNVGNPSSSNKAHGKRSRAEFGTNNNVKGTNGQDAVLENLSSGFGKIVQSFDKICYLMEKREARDNDLLDVMKETPGLTDEDCFKALDLLNTKAKQDFFLRMTPEQRYH
ncbi:unnamed protein product [Cuscuta epithymum]|uniref:At2g29880-like C-terminal domain-containing protein n=1 Tax=Cuscuta epithymum TaxID=186058 RepID=A0AAV0EZD0_9ASTE|nr:unnamed protein product [Cuscuta epithymum]